MHFALRKKSAALKRISFQFCFFLFLCKPADVIKIKKTSAQAERGEGGILFNQKANIRSTTEIQTNIRSIVRV